MQRAIENGIEYMGFSDHAPYVFPNGYSSNFRVPMPEAADYFAELSALREQYKDKIDIKIGFEMEYFPTYFSDMLQNVTALGAEYLILGQHFIGDEIPDEFHAIRPFDDPQKMVLYTDCVTSAINSGVFTYVAHPDMVNFTGDEAVFDEQVRRICRAAKEMDVPLELNCLGIRDHRIYPNEAFWKIVGEEGAPVTIGFDAHDAKSAFDGESIKRAKELIETYNLRYIGKPKLRALK